MCLLGTIKTISQKWLMGFNPQLHLQFEVGGLEVLKYHIKNML